MKCLILAAGYATRLYPLTENFPKPLLKVGDKAILDWLIEDIDRAGVVDEYVVISNHKFAGIFEEWAKGTVIPSGAKESIITVLDDGTTSNEQNPVHTYARDFAHYVVTLTVTGPKGTARCCKVWEVCVRDTKHPSGTSYD